MQATSSAYASGYSADSAAVVVDTSVPLPVTIKTDRAAEYASGGWWKDKVTVSFLDNGDAVLADGTPGSGVNTSLSKAPVSYWTSGSYTVTGQVTDYVGWKSAASSMTVKVDATPAAIYLKCPSYTYYRNQASATFTASDGQSGLSTPASGSITLDASSRGTKTLSVDARDKVGHVTTTSCTYSVY